MEDEAFVRRTTAEVLESAGYILVIAGTAAEALEACRMYSAPVDLLLTDVVMPGIERPRKTGGGIRNPLSMRGSGPAS